MVILSNPATHSRAAHYVRMSTEHQQYSPENHAYVIRQCAADHNMEIAQVYSDHGRSGLNIAGLTGLNQLIAEVENKQAAFTSLLVYDASLPLELRSGSTTKQSNSRVTAAFRRRCSRRKSARWRRNSREFSWRSLRGNAA
jgi:hypothetical protein